MHVKIIAIGTSKGVRIPKYLLDKYHFQNEADIEDTGSGILIKSAKKARANWKDAFEKIAGTKNDQLLEMPATEWDKDQWEW